MKMRLVWVLGVLAITTLFAVTCIHPNEPGCITFDSYQQIQVGMTRQQVEEILGGPARNESANPFESLHFMNFSTIPNKTWPEEWWVPHAAISIWFDLQGKVYRKNFDWHDYGPVKKPSFWDSIRSWLP
jgi:SmpA / OmlA family